MIAAEQLRELRNMTGSTGWSAILLPEIQRRYDSALNLLLHTPGQTDANMHKATGLASAYDYLIRGIPEWIESLEVQVEEENRIAEGDLEQPPPIM